MLYLILWAVMTTASIGGTVRAERGGAPVRGAQVRLPELSRSTISDSSGAFALPNVPAGQWRVTVTALGFLPYQTVVRVSDNGSIRLDIELSAVNALPMVRVRAPRDAVADARAARDRFNEEPTPSVTSMSQRELRAVPAAIEPDVMRSLQTLPGVVPLNDFDAQLYVRGGAADQNLVLFDGARIFGPFHMFGMTGAFNPDAVDEVTLFRGSLPARFGGALSSVVAIEQRDGTADEPVQGGLSLLGVRATTGGTFLGDRARWLVGLRRSHADLVFGGSMPYAFHDLQARVSFAPSASQQFSASLFSSSDRFRMFFGEVDEGSLTSRWSNLAGSVHWQRANGAARSTSVTLWGSQYLGQLATGDGPPTPTTRNHVSASGLRAEERWIGGTSAFRLGAELELGWIGLAGSDLTGNYFSSRDGRSYAIPSLYAEAESQLGPMRFAPAVRLTRDIRSGHLLVEPRLGARIVMRDSIALTLAAGRSHQVVSMLRDERTVVPGAPFWFVHPDGAPTSRTDGISAELDVPLANTWTLRAEAYGRRFWNLPHWRPEGARDFESISYDAGTSRGVEVSVRHYGERVSGWVGYGIGRTQLTQAATGDRYFPAWDRRHAITAVLMARPRPRLNLSLRVDYGSGQPFWPFAGEVGTPRFEPYDGGTDLTQLATLWGGDQLRLPAYFRADLGIRREFHAWGGIIEPYLTMQNITGRPNVVYYKLKTNRGEPTHTGDDVVSTLQPAAAPKFFIPSLGFNVRF